LIAVSDPVCGDDELKYAVIPESPKGLSGIQIKQAFLRENNYYACGD
jgi:hypothetical protein